MALRLSDRIAARLPHPLRKVARAAALAGAVFLAYPSLVAMQDVASWSSLPLGERWLAHLPELPGSSLVAASLGGSQVKQDVDPSAVASVGSAAYGARVTTRIGRQALPQRIARAGMGGRVVTATIARPPAYFSAGTVLERHSWTEPLHVDKRTALAFLEPLPAAEALKVAAAFHDPSADDAPAADKLAPVVATLVRESAPNVLAYAAEEETIASPFAVALRQDEPINLIPRLQANDHRWADDPLPASVLSDQEQHCLTAGVYFEARGEPVRGQAAVAQVILNRVRNPEYPDNICGVVYQNKAWRNRCQFSFACDRIKDKVNDPKRWAVAAQVAREVTEGRIWLAEVGSSTHYHANYVKPSWAASMRKAGQIGLHIFYKTFGGGWS
jgi:spore germination cell wall hydrolase CwlJ-like protein